MMRREERNFQFRRFLLVALMVFSAACSKQQDIQQAAEDRADAAQMIAQADKLYEERADLTRTREGVVQLRRALAADAGSYDAAWRLARFDYFLGTHTNDEKERDKAYTEGMDAGRRAVRLQDGRPEGHFWLGANLGGQAETSKLNGMAAIDLIRGEMERVIQLDEGFQGGSAYMALGQVDLEAPGMLGGDKKRAVEVLEKGLRFGQNNALYHLRLAQAYLAVDRKADARKELETVLNMKPDPAYLPEYNDAAAEARKLLDETK